MVRETTNSPCSRQQGIILRRINPNCSKAWKRRIWGTRAAVLTAKRKGRSGGLMKSIESNFGTKCEWRLFLSWSWMISIMGMKLYHRTYRWKKPDPRNRAHHHKQNIELKLKRRSWTNLITREAALQKKRKPRKLKSSQLKQTFPNWWACSHLNLAGRTLVHQIKKHQLKRLPFQCLEVSWETATKKQQKLWLQRILSSSTSKRNAP